MMFRWLQRLVFRILSGLSEITDSLFAFLMSGKKVRGLKVTVAYTKGVPFSKSTWIKLAFLVTAVAWWVAQRGIEYFLMEGHPPMVLGWLTEVAQSSISKEWTDIVLLCAVVLTAHSVIVSKRRCHEVVDSIARLNYRLFEMFSNNDPASISITDLVARYCSLAVEVFEEDNPGGKIGCAYRMWDEGGFVTVTRSGYLDRRRASTSMPLTSNSPLLRALQDPEYQGHSVFSILDSSLALVDDPDPNRHNEAFSQEDRSFLVSRIVVKDLYDSEELSVFGGESMDTNYVCGVQPIAHDKVIGLFYITSSRAYAFDADVVELFQYLAVSLNTAILNVLDAKAASMDASTPRRMERGSISAMYNDGQADCGLGIKIMHLVSGIIGKFTGKMKK